MTATEDTFISRRIVVLLLLAAAGSGAVAYGLSRRNPIVASAQIVVILKFEGPEVSGCGYPSESDFISTQSNILRSLCIAERAVQSKWLHPMPGGTEQVDAQMILDSLSVEGKGKDSCGLFTLTVRGVSPEEGEMILRAVIDAYQQFLDDVYAPKDGEMAKQIKNLRADLIQTVDDAKPEQDRAKVDALLEQQLTQAINTFRAKTHFVVAVFKEPKAVR